MSAEQRCPACGTAMRPIVWGYATLSDVADAGDVVIGGCVIDVDPTGRRADFECPACGTRADAHGDALERPAPRTSASAFPFSAANREDGAAGSAAGPRRPAFQDPAVNADASSEPGGDSEIAAADDHALRASAQADDLAQLDALAVGEDFDAAFPASTWRERVPPYTAPIAIVPAAPPPHRDHVQPYASHEDPLPEHAAPRPEQVQPYGSREDALPEHPAPRPDRVQPYGSREDALPERAEGRPDRVQPYGSRDDELPESRHERPSRVDPYSSRD